MDKELPAVDKPRQKSNRKTRIPLDGNMRDLLFVRKKHPDYHYRWVLNDPDRIAKFKDAWWEIDDTPENTSPGDRRVDTSVGTSSIVETRAGSGRKFILMKLPKELREQDVKAKHKAVDDTEAGMLQEAKQGRYGSITVDRSGTAANIAPTDT